MKQAALVGRALQRAASMDGETFECPPKDGRSDIACLLEDWVPPQDWGEVEVTPEAVELWPSAK